MINDSPNSIKYLLSIPYPNPFNSRKTFYYGVPKNQLVNITIYDVMGKQVKELVNRLQNIGYKSISWNGYSDDDSLVAGGLYYYTMKLI